MRPIKLLRSLLTHQSTSTSDELDDEQGSPSGSWLLLSNSNDEDVTPTQVTTTDQGCQTQPRYPSTAPKPRSTIRPFEAISTQAGLPPPTFLPKSKLPRLHYGGLTSPDLHCFGSSLIPKDKTTPVKNSIFLAPTAKSLPSPTTFCKTPAALQSSNQKAEIEATRARSWLLAIFYESGFASKLFSEIHTSAFVEQHINRIADSLGTGGLLMYLQVWNHWACWCQCHGFSPAEAPLSLVLDYLHASDHLKRKKDSKPSRTRMMTNIKALRWIALKLDLPVLTASLQSQTVADFLKSQIRIPFERSEASPTPLAVLAAWEQRVISNQSSLPEIITLGCFLIATMASLRFRDLLRTKESLSVQGHILRGISWRTKTSVSGQPWGVCCLSLTTRPSEKHWVFPFLEAIQIGLTKYSGVNIGTLISFSLRGRIPFLSPLHVRIIMLLHLFVFIPNATGCNHLLLSAEEAKHLSTHSMKSTMLAAAGQLNMNLEQRAKQGHHKKSVQLYSREDVCTRDSLRLCISL